MYVSMYGTFHRKKQEITAPRGDYVLISITSFIDTGQVKICKTEHQNTVAVNCNDMSYQFVAKLSCSYFNLGKCFQWLKRSILLDSEPRPLRSE